MPHRSFLLKTGAVVFLFSGLMWFPIATTEPSPSESSAPASPVAVSQDLPTLIRQVRKSVVLVRGKMQGTGFAINATHIITNAHVVEDTARGDRKIFAAPSLKTDDGQTIKLKVVKVDWDGDIAILARTDSQPHSLPYLGRSELAEVGQSVIAIGSPYGLSNTVTTGIVSALRAPGTAKVRGAKTNTRPVIQTSAAINPGNSGGPLLDEQGQVLGMVFARTTDAEGLAFVIPIDQVWSLLKKL